jgi:hypothetical protein
MQRSWQGKKRRRKIEKLSHLVNMQRSCGCLLSSSSSAYRPEARKKNGKKEKNWKIGNRRSFGL